MKLGEVQNLIISRSSDHGLYLSDGTDQVLLPQNEVTPDMEINDEIEVFLYKDSEDRLIATRTSPAITLGKVSKLKVVDVTPIGAFLDWGLAKDLLLPFKEQTTTINNGDELLVALYIDKTDRLCATMKIYDYLNSTSPYNKDDVVTGQVYEIIDNFGAFVAVDNIYSGLIPNKELHQPLNVGQDIEARVTRIQQDGKLDLSLNKKAHLQLHVDGDMIFERLQETSNGFLAYHDKSNAGEIKKEFGISKNAFKRAIGHLLKEGKIEILRNGIKLTDNLK